MYVGFACNAIAFIVQGHFKEVIWATTRIGWDVKWLLPKDQCKHRKERRFYTKVDKMYHVTNEVYHLR